ncbi:MAG: hypothetical protein GY847_39175 [Proteobacteria bacterium]|nr:hypothetical protein [Pseudomonadota bacterium]
MQNHPQRFGSALNLNPHFHSLLLEGVFNARSNVFHPAPPLQDEGVKEIVETIAHRVFRLLRKGNFTQSRTSRSER